MLQLNLKKVCPAQDYNLDLTYENDEIRRFDVKPYIEGSWYSELKDLNYFRTVHLLPGGRGIEWPHGQDIAPHELYEDSVPYNGAVANYENRR